MIKVWFQKLYSSQANQTSSKIFGGWNPSEEQLKMGLLHQYTWAHLFSVMIPCQLKSPWADLYGDFLARRAHVVGLISGHVFSKSSWEIMCMSQIYRRVLQFSFASHVAFCSLAPGSCSVIPAARGTAPLLFAYYCSRYWLQLLSYFPFQTLRSSQASFFLKLISVFSSPYNTTRM